MADCHLDHWVWQPEDHINLSLTLNLSNLSKKSKNEITNFSESMSQAPLSFSLAHEMGKVRDAQSRNLCKNTLPDLHCLSLNLY